MKILSWNVNGLRSIYKKGFSEWLYKSDADVVCLQEIKAHEHQIPNDLFLHPIYDVTLSCATQRGYSGVAVYTKQKPLVVNNKLGYGRFDAEGRILSLEYQDFILICLYLPHGGRKKQNLLYKLEAYKHLLDYVDKIKNNDVILCGDFNVAHREIDLARPKQNRDNVMFTLEERQQVDLLLSLGFTDTFRNYHNEGGDYTWWPYAGSAREKNIGWRIDYIFTSQSLTSKLMNAYIMNEVTGSDHCPIGIDLYR